MRSSRRGTHRRPAAPSAWRRTAARCSRRPTAWRTSSTTCRTRPDTIFEAGSVSKQFTAAAVLLLAQRRQALARRSGAQVRPRAARLRRRRSRSASMLHHTSGLRDWGSVDWHRRLAARHARLHARPRARHPQPAARAQLPARHALVLQQHRATTCSAIIVSRVSGRVVRRVHAQAHLRAARHDAHVLARRLHAASSRTARSPTRRRADAIARDMPFENVHGNGGLLTTVGDLLRWNENFVRAESRRRRFHPPHADLGPAGYRPRDGLRVWPGARELQGSRRSPAQRHDRQLSRLPRPVPGEPPVRRRAVQCRQQHAATGAARASPISTSAMR